MTTALGQVDPIKVVDHYDPDDGDATHPARIDYIAPADLRAVLKATLSWKLRAFRSTVNLNPSTISTDASGSSGHSHNHAHTIPMLGGQAGPNVVWNGVGTSLGFTGVGGNTSAINSDATGESGHSHSHTHTLTGTGTQAVTEGNTATVTAIAIDGKDVTAALGGPWSSDIVEMDISSVFQAATGVWHTIELSLSGLGRVVSMLRIRYTT